AFATALLLALVPLRIMPPGLAFVLFALGTALLALSSFGREFGLKTFSLILAQPLERRRIWRIKIRLLAIAMGVVFLAWCMGWRMFHPMSLFYPDGHRAYILGLMPFEPEALVGLIVVIVAFAGGLWTTLLFRQMVSAFWFCALIPAVIQMIVLAS